jgi:hypothetical protein
LNESSVKLKLIPTPVNIVFAFSVTASLYVCVPLVVTVVVLIALVPDTDNAVSPVTDALKLALPPTVKLFPPPLTVERMALPVV